MFKDSNHRVFKGSYEAFLQQDDQDLVRVPVNILRNILGFSFEIGARHPFTQGMLDYAADKTISPDHTAMAQFYRKFRPRTLLEAFFDAPDHPLLKELNTNDLTPLIKTSSKYLLTPWAWELIEMGGFGQSMAKQEGSHFLGPVTQRHLHSEFKRLTGIYDTVAAEGFDVDKQTDTIRGYFMKKGPHTRFVVVGGNHRVGVLCALGYTHIPVAIHKHRLPWVDIDALDTWPQVKNAVFTRPMATSVFERFFTGVRT